MKTVVILGVLFLCGLLPSCRSPEPAGSQKVDHKHAGALKPQVAKVVSQIHEGMTFLEISRIVPISSGMPDVAREHGGVWYAAPLDGCIIEMRFQRPTTDKDVNQCVLNLPPRVLIKNK